MTKALIVGGGIAGSVTAVALRKQASRRPSTRHIRTPRASAPLVDAKINDDGVTAHFADGTTASGDLLIGADGIDSRTRTIIDPNAPAARYVGLLNAGGYARGVSVPGEAGVMRMVFGKRCFFPLHPEPERRSVVVRQHRQQKPAQQSRNRRHRPRAELLDLVRDDEMWATELINATPHIDAGRPTFDFPAAPTWHDDRMTIIGDAAHAVSPSAGQCASMAIEDAAVLAKCLRDLPTIPEAFAAYDNLRRQRVERIVEQGRKSGEAKIPGPLTRVLRDHVILPMVFKNQSKGTSEPLGWMFDYHVDWNQPISPLSAAR
jgi:2-polyprenyl-6-methoxyphenol hydroxylase-like FAD-dependent oxidoreductase